MDSKKVREENTRLQKETKRLLADQTRLEQNGLSFILQAQLTQSQLIEVKEIVVGEKGADPESGGETSSEMRELKRKLADKSEQLRMLQGISTVYPIHYYIVSVSSFVIQFNLMLPAYICIWSSP